MKGFVQFVAVSGVGFLLDIALALLLRQGLGLPLWLAATISFFVVACLNYLAFEHWIFRDPERAPSLRRLLGVLGASSIAVVARVGTILALTPLVARLLEVGTGQDTVLLVVGAGVSVVVNFAVNKWLVFKDGTA